MSKSRLASGRIKKVLGDQLKSDRYSYLDLSNAEPDLGNPEVNESVLIGDINGSRTWTDITTYAEQFKGYSGSAGYDGSRGLDGYIGSQGDIGYSGSQGPQGNFGGVTFDYTFDSLTTAEDPGVGKLRISETFIADVLPMQMYIGDTDDTNTNLDAYLITIDSSTSLLKGHVRISNKANSDDFVILSITGNSVNNGTYFTVPVSFVSGSATGFDNFEDIIVTFAKTGDKGDIGYTGSRGAVGFTGSQGDIGFTGSAGIDGTSGTSGVNGYAGSQGYTGSHGDTGYTGSFGLTGYTGSQGTQGNLGYHGSTGFTGSQGIQGDIGYTGSQGVQGIIGLIGSQGDVGFTGSQGIQGVPGTGGAGGTDGTPGYTGSQGITGYTGSQGIPGTGGTAGYTGSQGIQGFTGFTGSQGIQGFTGSAATDGVAGFTGSQGTIGFTGSKGVDGQFGGASFYYKFENLTFNESLAAGELLVNNVDFGAATFVAIHNLDRFATDISDFLQTVDDSTSDVKGYLKITDESDYTNFVIFAIVGVHTIHTTHFHIPASYISGTTTPFADMANIIVSFTLHGDRGDTGYTGSLGESSFSYSDTAPLDPVEGDRWFDSETGCELVWTLDGDTAQWVEVAASGFVGYTGSQGYGSVNFYTRNYLGDAVTTGFAVTTGLGVDNVFVFENGIMQFPTTDYTIAGSVLTFATAPAAGVAVQIRELNNGGSEAVPVEVKSQGTTLTASATVIDFVGNVVATTIGNAVTVTVVAGSPKITNVQVTNNSYIVLDDTAVDIAGGYIKLIGTGFASGCSVLINNTPVTSVTYISDTEVQAQVQSTAAGTYVVYLVNSDGGVAIRVNGITFSATPAWSTGSTLPAGDEGSAISIQLSAPGATTYALAAGSTLPGTVTLSSSGLISGAVSGVTNTTTYSFTVIATDDELQDSPRTFSITITSGDQYFNSTTLLLRGNADTFVRDASTNNFAVTVVGDTKPNNFNPYLTGWSNYFDGTGDYLATPVSAAFTFGTGPFTIEAWINPAIRPPSTVQWIYGNMTTGTGNTQIGISITTTGLLQLQTWNSVVTITTSAIPLNAWTHIAAAFDGTTYRLFINGILSASSTTIFTLSTDGSGTVGYNGALAGNQLFTGYISNLRVVKGTAVYTTAFTPPTSPLAAIAGTSLLTCADNRFVDDSTNNFTITRNGDVKIQSFSPFVETATTRGSTYFDGTGDYLSLPDNDAFNCGTGNFTLETWYYHDGGTALYPSIFSSTDWSTGTGGLGLRFNNTGMANKFGFFWYGVGDPFLTASFTSAPYAWHHVAVTRVSNTFTLWVDGVSAATGTASGTVNFNLTTGGPRIGWGPWDAANGYVKAYISNLRVVKGTALYTAAFTPPTQPLTAVAGTSLLTLQNNTPVANNTFLDSSSNNLLVTRAGNATQGTFSPYSPSGWSAYFDGTGDNLTVATTALTGTWTVEFWAYHTAAGGSEGAGYVFNGTTSSNANRIQLGRNANGAIYFYSESTSPTSYVVQSANNAVALNTWYHIAVVSNSSTIKIYLNGVEVASGSITNTPSSGTSLSIGFIRSSAALQYFPGYISNFRYTRTAVYTAAFTPPTQPLTAVAGTSLLTCADNRFVDESLNNLAITRTGNTRVTNFSPFKAVVQTPVSYSAYFDGTGDFLTLSTAPVAATGTFTVECWVYVTGTAAAQSIYGQYIGGASAAAGRWNMLWNDAANKFSFSIAATSYASASTYSTNTWYHIAWVRDGSDNLSLYVNGVRDSTNAAVSTSLYTGNPIIGARSDGTTPYTGYISNFRVTNTVVYSGTTYTVPTVPLTAIAGTSLLTCQSATFVDNSTNKFAITALGNSQPTTVNPFGSTFVNSTGYTAAEYSGSMYFDGTGDYLSLTSSPVIQVGSSDFVAEAWVYSTVYSGNGNPVFAFDTNASYYAAFRFGYGSTGGVELYMSTNGTTHAISAPAGLGTVPLNQWTHMALSKTGTAVRVFLNGVQQGSTLTLSSATLMTGSNYWIGYLNAPSAQTVYGYISDARLVKGISYTSNFVPPLAPLLPIPNTTLLLNGTSAAITDATTKNDVETIGDAKISTAVSKFGGSSMYFDGTGDYLTVPSNINTNLSAAYTVECWFYTTSLAAESVIWVNGTYGSDNNRIQVSIRTTGRIDLYSVNAGADNYYPQSAIGAIVINTWYHVAAVSNGTTATLYVNGTSVASSAITGTPPVVNTVYVGYGRTATTDKFFNGYIQDFRITRGVARYTATFTPPTTAFVAK